MHDSETWCCVRRLHKNCDTLPRSLCSQLSSYLAIMSRPKSMPDFTALMDASAPVFEKRIHSRRDTSPERRIDHARKRQSFSLATELIMKSEMPRSLLPPGSPRKRSRERWEDGGKKGHDEPGNMFYAYAMKVRMKQPFGNHVQSDHQGTSTNNHNRAIMLAPRPTCLPSPPPPSARNGGLL